MKKTISISLLIFGFISMLSAQSADNLRSQLEYCKKESAKFETSLESYKKLLEIQGSQIMELKTTIQTQETQIKNLTTSNQKLEAVAIELLNLGATYEQMGKYQEAIEIYKLLMRNYPNSMESISSRLRVIDLKKQELNATKTSSK